MKYINLQDIDVPRLGFGTWQLDKDSCGDAVQAALDTGYRHIDTAQAYNNEELVGQALTDAGVSRDEIFLTTKVFRDEFETISKAMESIDNSLRKLQTDYVDLLLVHWPFPEYAIERLLAPMIKAQEEGKTRLIGVSNFTLDHMEQAQKISNGRVCVNQIEYHPKLNQQPLIDWTRRHGWALTAYSPLGRGDAMDDDTIQEIADNHGKDASQIILRWMMQHDNVIAIPKSATPDHIRSNFDIWDFELSSDEMQKISGLRAANNRHVDPDFAPDWDVAA
jgi:diketogulonate reductase-like aldo/keto reductase